MLIGSAADCYKKKKNDTAKEGDVTSLEDARKCFKRSRRRRRIAILSVLWLTVTLMAVLAAPIKGMGGKWLQHRLLQLAAAHIEDPPITATADATTSSTLGQDVEFPSPLLVVATHEGQVWTIDSTDGSLVAGFSTGPPLLVVDDHYDEDDGSSFPSIPSSLSQSRIVPSMDGMLYWRQPNTEEEDNSNNNNLVPIASIRELVDNPIQICQQVDGDNCDILTATSLGPSLFSLNSQGSLNWARARTSKEATRAKPVPLQRKSSDSSVIGEAENDDDSASSEGSVNSNASNSKTNLLLQRQDYLVQQISTETGEQVWNITWGSLEALDFVGDDKGSAGTRRRSDQSFNYLPSEDDPLPSDLPSLIFSNKGKSLVAVWAQPPKFLWKRDFISVVTNVLGIERNSWQAVNVVADDDGIDNGSLQDKPAFRRQELLSDVESQVEESRNRWYWWFAGGASGLGKKSKPTDMEKFFIHAQEEHGLIFVPRPPAHGLVRNSWYLNHLWDSPQAMGAQNFQGYLDDHAHGEEDARDSQRQNHGKPRTPKRDRRAYPLASADTFYDTSSMPRLLLLPPPSEPSGNTGGVFLSWSVVVGIITLLVGTVGAAYVVYGQKKRKWMARSTAQETSSPGTNSHGHTGLSSDSVSLSMLTNQDPSSANRHETAHSRSKGRSLSDPQEEAPASSVSSRPTFGGKPVKHVLNRSSSAPIMMGDHELSPATESDTHGLASSTTHSREVSPEKCTLTSQESREDVKPSVKPSVLVKHQSAPVDAPTLPQGGVGMIDGIPLIRYSRYQSEFKEIEPLGRGGFGTVFRVENMLDGREYAVKKVSIRSSDWSSPGTEAFSQELHRVLREVKFLALLDHPNIVRYYTAWLEMEEAGESTETDENTNINTLSRRFSSELLTSLDQTNCHNTSESQVSPSRSHMQSSGRSRATLSHLKGRNSTNPLGWNNDFGKFDESSRSARYQRHTLPVLPPMDEDCGFIFEERSDEEEEEEHPSFMDYNGGYFHGRSTGSSDCSKSEHSHSMSSSWDASFSLNRRQKLASAKKDNHGEEKKGDGEPRRRRNSGSSKHTLYIQMQLCSSKTLGDFLSNKEARQGHSASSGSVDVPGALRLFLQIVQAVHHVHKQGLIHRDLKPVNCFVDDTGTVKVGDFGLSRESNETEANNASVSPFAVGQEEDDGAGDHTVGVGTRSYASPEQMNGSDYDFKTDIYALGVMLFELLYPMYTGMERHICFQKLRKEGIFPEGWHSSVCVPFPMLNELVQSMLSLNPKDRPTADKIARQIQSLLDEHSITLNVSRHDSENEHIIFVRVEAKPVPDVLKVTTDLIHGAAAPKTVEIVQYGMRSSSNSANSSNHKIEKRAILEFALACTEVDAVDMPCWGTNLVAKLEDCEEVLVARRVWHQTPQLSL